MLKPMLAGARLSIEIEPAGTLVRTSSPFVTGRRVTLLDVNADALFKDDTLLQRLQAAATPEEMKTILKSVPEYQTESRSGDHDRVHSIDFGLRA